MSTAKWSWNAKDYAKNSSAQLQWAQELIAKIGLQGNESVLDIGCGDGKISAQIAQSVPNGNVTGIDLSEEMIRLAREQFPPTQYSNLSFIPMDAVDIHLSKQFDIAFSNAVLHWVGDHRAVLRGVRQHLKLSGRILFQMGGYGNAEDVSRVFQKVIKNPRWQTSFQNFTPPYHFYRPDEYKCWLTESGFQPERVELIPKDMQHPGIQGLLGWLRTTWFPYTDCVPAELRESLLAEVVENYMADYPLDASGNTHVKMVRLEVEARVTG